MAKDLIIERQEVGVPPTPVIVKDLYSLDGGVEIVCNVVDDDYVGGVIEIGDANHYPKVLKAGHLLFCVEMPEMGIIWMSAPTEDGSFVSFIGSLPVINVGVLKHDAVVYPDGEFPCCIGAVMLMGAVDCDYMPAKVVEKSIFDGDKIKSPEACNITFLNRKFE